MSISLDRRHGLLAVLILWLPAITPAAPPPPEALASRVEEYMDARVRRDRFSGTILIARDGKVLFCQGYGLANREHSVPCTPQTKYRLGSITKQFTAMAVLILQEQGKLSASDPVKKHFPQAPKAWDGITIHHLLTHTSGIPNYTSFPDFLRTLPDRVTLSALIGKFKDKPLEFRPGEKFRYSNSGYIVLGQVIESASGTSYPTFLKRAILDPLGMHDTGYDNAIPILEHRASGYARRLGLVITNADYVDMSIPHAAGALYSTVEDLLTWDRAIAAGKLVSRKSLDTMFTPFKDNYAYGWLVDRKFNRPRQAHGGGIMGFVTTIQRYPSEQLLVVALSNLEGSPVGAIGNDLAAIALGEPYIVPREPKVVAVDPRLYDTYAGHYEAELPEGGGKQEIAVTRQGDRLMVQPKGRAKVEVVPEASTRFYVKAVDGLVEFVKGPGGAVTEMVVYQDNRWLRARRVEAKPEAARGGPAQPKADASPTGPKAAPVPR
jgi:CubicO group peptidase (beta-lactamase class C family)